MAHLFYLGGSLRLESHCIQVSMVFWCPHLSESDKKLKSMCLRQAGFYHLILTRWWQHPVPVFILLIQHIQFCCQRMSWWHVPNILYTIVLLLLLQPWVYRFRTGDWRKDWRKGAEHKVLIVQNREHVVVNRIKKITSWSELIFHKDIFASIFNTWLHI